LRKKIGETENCVCISAIKIKKVNTKQNKGYRLNISVRAESDIKLFKIERKLAFIGTFI
jgi:hypothetical protein